MKLFVQMLFYVSMLSVILIIGVMLLVSLVKDYKRLKKEFDSKR